jgi:DNA modification methylase
MTPWLDDGDVRLYHGDSLDVLRTLPDKSVHMCCTSPPFFGLRDYGTGEWEGGDPDCDHAVRREVKVESSTLGGGTKNSGHQQEGYGSECGRCAARRVDRQIGLEETPDQWVQNLVRVFREVRRVLRDDGTLWVEIGDSYASSGNRTGEDEPRRDMSGGFGGKFMGTYNQQGHAKSQRRTLVRNGEVKPKDLLGQPWLLAFALRADGWYLRSEIIWARPNPMPESVTDRPTKSHSTVFLLSKQPRYYFDADAIREPHQHDGRHVTQVVGKENSKQHRNGERWPGSGANSRSVWTIPTQPTPFAHFATWPEALCRRMILAGTSERGCCPECGAPWVRDVERADDGTRDTRSNDRAIAIGHDPSAVWRAGEARSATTLGWSPFCGHQLEPVPCTVLDPFAGSATTMLVARNHGRHSIGIELNEDYLKIAAKRLQQLSLLA